MKQNLWDNIGNTALLKIQSLSDETGCEILGKAEFLNPSGSIKDRAAKAIIQEAEDKGLIKPGDSIVEGTAGNTGIGLAMLCAERGYHCIVSMPDNQAQQKYQYLKSLGAEVIALPPVPFANPNHFYHYAKKLSEERPNTYWANQFENLANYRIHYATTGPEIWKQSQEGITDFVSAVGTGGSMAGCSDYLKGKNSKIKVTLADPMGSGLYNYIHSGEMKSESSSITEGIGIMRLTDNFKKAKIDDAIQITDQEMLDILFRVSKEDGLFLGTSSALNLAAAYRIAKKEPGKKIITFLCDSGTRYADKILNSEWLKSKGLRPPAFIDN